MSTRQEKKLAVFDIDGTVFRSSLLIEITEALINEGVFPKKARRIYGASYRAWVERRGTYEDYLAKVILAFDKYLRGVSQKVFLQIAQKVVAFHKNRVYRFTRDLIKKLKERGYCLIAISGSPLELVENFAKNIGFSFVYGRERECDEKGFFTGRVKNEEIIESKEKILKDFLKKNGFSLKNSIGVGDTESDIGFLKMVARPIAFNPNKKLFLYAKRHHWPIIVERKDVIYKINYR